MSFKYEGIFERWCLIGGNRALGMWPQEAVSCLASCYSSSFLFIGCLPQPGCTGILILWDKRNLYVFWAHRFGPSDEVPAHTLSVQTFIAFVWVRQLSLRSSLWIWLEAPQCFWAYYWLLPVHMDDFTDSRQLNAHRGHIQGNVQSRDVFFLLHSLCVTCKVSMRL